MRKRGTIVMKMWKRIFCFMLAGFLFVSVMPQNFAEAKKAADCKSLCGAVLKVTGGTGQLKYQSASAFDFGGLSASAKKKVKSISYLCDAKEVYSLCVMQAKNVSDAKMLQKQMKKYKKNNGKSAYLSDYSSAEQSVFKNAVYGRKRQFVWYIAMSAEAKVNAKGQEALLKKL